MTPPEPSLGAWLSDGSQVSSILSHPRPELAHRLRGRAGPAVGGLRRHRRPGPGRLPPAPGARPDHRLARPGAGSRAARPRPRRGPRRGHRCRRDLPRRRRPVRRRPAAARPHQRHAPQPHPEGTVMIDKLQAHYGFTRMPFGRDLAPGMLHRHAAHNEACARITWCIAERAIGVITGEVGAGKTVSVRTVLAGLDASRHTIIYLPNPMIGIRGLHEMIVATFGGQPDRSYSRLTAQASAMLAAERDERGKTPVLVIDEAHLLRYEQLETIRMLTNHNLDADSPLACLLIGQPTLRRTMKLAVLAALEQRTALRYAMPPMTSQETSSYISHHLKLAGRSDPLFSDDAAALIHTTSRGYPRAVNNLAIQALVATYAAGKAIVDEQAARAAITEVTDT